MRDTGTHVIISTAVLNCVMVAQLPLEQSVWVKILVRQPIRILICQGLFFYTNVYKFAEFMTLMISPADIKSYYEEDNDLKGSVSFPP